MARKLKAYQTSIGFYELVIAAPSMKAALDAWGAGSNLFHQGVAKESQDPAVVAATMAKPGVVLRRPVGSDGLSGSTHISQVISRMSTTSPRSRQPHRRQPRVPIRRS